MQSGVEYRGPMIFSNSMVFVSVFVESLGICSKASAVEDAGE